MHYILNTSIPIYRSEKPYRHYVASFS